MSGGLDRRDVLAGAAWSAPVILVGASAPAVAASPPVVMRHITQFQWYSNNAPYCSAGYDGFRFNSTASGTGVTFSPSTTATTISDVYAYFWFTRLDFGWSPDTGNSGCWTVPVFDGTTAVNGGRTYYRYVTRYTCPITVVSGTTTLQPYAWRSVCLNVGDTAWDNARYIRKQAFATVNGAEQATDTGYTSIQGFRAPDAAPAPDSADRDAPSASSTPSPSTGSTSSQRPGTRGSSSDDDEPTSEGPTSSKETEQSSDSSTRTGRAASGHASA